jgi:hypothetical protein
VSLHHDDSEREVPRPPGAGTHPDTASAPGAPGSPAGVGSPGIACAPAAASSPGLAGTRDIGGTPGTVGAPGALGSPAGVGSPGIACAPDITGAPGSPDADHVVDGLRRAFREAVTGVQPSVWPGRAVLERAGRMRRNRRVTITLSAAAVVVAAGGGVMAAEHQGAPATGTQAAAPATPGSGHGTGPAPAAPTATSAPPRPALTWPVVRVVQPRHVVVLGAGPRLRLEPSRRCLGTPGDWTCKSVSDGNQAAGSVSLQSQGDASGTLYTPLYIGGGTAARMSVTVAGHEYPLQVVTLPGRPGYATGYGRAPSPPGTDPAAFSEVKVTVYDAHGTVLATLP